MRESFADFKGFVYEEGRGTIKNEKEAIVWYEKAAQLGHGESQYRLGNRAWSLQLTPIVIRSENRKDVFGRTWSPPKRIQSG